MGMYIVQGGKRIEGEFCVRGSKNASLPILAACILAEDEVVLENLPFIRDVLQTLDILKELGCRVEVYGRTAVIDSSSLKKTDIDNDTVRKMRSSILFLGALLGREKEAKLACPGGCAIGRRPIDLHLAAFERMGAVFQKEGEMLSCRAEKITGTTIHLPFPSVGATENILLLAAKAEGVTVIRNAAREPEIIALVRFLRAMGAEIYGEGTGSILVEGVKRLHGAFFPIPADRIEGGTFLCAAAMTGGELVLKGLEREQMEAVLEVLCMAGCCFFWEGSDLLRLKPPKRLVSGFAIETGPFPAFPTDMQPLVMSLLTLARGRCMISETVFEARFSQAEGLCRMGADICISGGNALIRGVETLHGAEVFAKDLRCGAALLVAALAAEGKSIIHGSEYVERGYEKIEDAFSFLGGEIMLQEERKTYAQKEIEKKE